MPPGPPVLQTLVAEVYGPDPERRLDAGARRSATSFEKTPGVVDVDWYVEDAAAEVAARRRRREGGAQRHVARPTSPRSCAWRAPATPAGLLHDARAREDVPIVLRLPREPRGSLDARRERSRLGPATPVALGELTRVELDATRTQSIYHKNLHAGDLRHRRRGRRDRKPGLRDPADEPRARRRSQLPEGYGLEHLQRAPAVRQRRRYAMKWDGEWHITYEVFRDLGIAFAAVLILIYVLVVGWFQSFMTPLDRSWLAIPFSLVGILPAHALLGAFFTATSMIGFIAGAGIVVRNSIILVDFIELRLQRRACRSTRPWSTPARCASGRWC